MKKKIYALILACITLVGVCSGCGEKKAATDDGRTEITIGKWPDEDTNAQQYESRMKTKDEFEAKYPDLKVVGDAWSYSLDTFTAKAEGKTLPTLYNTWATEIQKIINMNYAADITEQLKKANYYDSFTNEIKSIISRDGKIYMIPESVYSFGLVINLNLFKEAGLMNADGSPKIPETFDDVREMAKIVHEKTGKAGFLFPTTSNFGGWSFMPLAWSFGGKFEEEISDGKYKAVFASDEVANAFKLLYDMKWTDQSMPSNTLINNDEAMKQIAVDQAAMTFAHPGQLSQLVQQNGMSIDAIAYAKMPAGPVRHVTLTGGDYLAVAPNATTEQINGVIRWLEFTGTLPQQELTDETKQQVRRTMQTQAEKGNVIIGIKDLTIWNQNNQLQQYKDELTEEFRNIDEKMVASYNDKSGIEYQAEEAVCTQDLYGILDGCIQEVLNNQNVDIPSVLKTAQENFQANYLDKLK